MNQKIEDLFIKVLANLRSTRDSSGGFRDAYQRRAILQVEELRRLIQDAEREAWQHAGRNICIICGGQGFDEPEESIR